MFASKLFKDICLAPDIFVEGLSENSKTVKQNYIFFAINGKNVDGAKYATKAVEQGACLVVAESKINLSVPVLVVDNVREVMGVVCSRFYSRPEKLIAVVGTSGKTSTCYILDAILSKKYKVGMIGTTGAYIDHKQVYYGLTTPDTIDLHRILEQMKHAGVQVVVMEMSAQAITMSKMSGLFFDIAVFTNISVEHIDYFKSMEDYIETKFSLFTDKYVGECVVNVDDVCGQTLARSVSIPSITYGVFSPSNTFAIDIEYGVKRSSFVANVLDNIMYVDTCLIGEYNVYNILASLTVGKMLKVDIDDMVVALLNVKMKGRNEVLPYGKSTIVLDFAHTVDSVEKILQFYKSVTKGRVLVVIGCTGYSDKEKRKSIGQVVDRFADIVCLAPDNPDFENVAEINSYISSFICRAQVHSFSDRKIAISTAMGMLKANDTLLVLGKAGEEYQKINGQKISYSDRAVVEELIGEQYIETSVN